MEHINGSRKCPFNGESEQLNGDKDNGFVKTPLRIKLPQALPLKNHVIDFESADNLHSKIDEESTSVPVPCGEKVCLSSVMHIPGRGETPRTPEEVYKEAQVFIKQFYRSMHSEDSVRHRQRINEIKEEIDKTGTYQLHYVELVFGAKTAWRNATRCIGRATWRNLTFLDCRSVTTATGMFDALCRHIKYSTNKGNINSAISIFPQRTDGKHDYRIWNPQLIGYAGYRQPDGSVIGDPARVEFTEVCKKLGWKGEGTAWDILPLVLSADGKAPEYFDIPREIIMEVEMEHPKYDWFKELGMRWYAVPAVSNMRLDCGGIEFTATAFNGWYMSTEIACRTFCDINRFNMIETVASHMGLDVGANPPIWKDKALVEVNVAVIHSFQRDQVTIIDHHTASETFMNHLKNENRVRGGCPADWIWIVPPMSSSLTPVFHQEMALYFLRPSYDYQPPAWKNYKWIKPDTGTRTVKRKFHFKQIARAVRFTSKLFSSALSKRVKATILYASETGKSEQYAKDLATIFGHAFNTQVQCMSKYDFYSIEHETLLLIVASTFGDGVPPTNGTEFMRLLLEMLNEEKQNQVEEKLSFSAGSTPYSSSTPRSLKRMTSILAASMEFSRQASKQNLQREISRSSVKSGMGAASDQISALSNVRFAVFGLGSSAYRKFGHFAVTVDSILDELGADRLMPVVRGDELFGQEQTFRKWSFDIFQTACETFCLDENDMMKDAERAFDLTPLTPETVRFGKPLADLNIIKALEAINRKQLSTFKVEEVKVIGKHEPTDSTTVFVNLESQENIHYEPGDHIAVIPSNPKDIVDAILSRLTDVDDYDKKVQVLVLKEKLTPTGIVKSWGSHDDLPPASARDIFTRFVDITTPPKTPVLKYLASACTDEKEAAQMRDLVADSNKIDDWNYFHHPHLAEVLAQFPSCRPMGAVLAALLPPLQPRRYSISSSPAVHDKNIHLTVAVVVFRTQNGNGPRRYGVCSTYLQNLTHGEEVLAFIKKAPTFHLPKQITAPIIMVGPGTGIAPFRGFWHHRRHQIQHSEVKPGQVSLYFGCKYKEMDLYKEEKELMVKEGVINNARLAISREAGVEKKYVQAFLDEDGADISRMITQEKGHFYVCGDIKMAEDVQQKLKEIIIKHEEMTEEEADDFVISMMNENRYHQDIYGITFRTAEVNSASRETAKRTRCESIR
ncbi:nitric oxide synthase-like [Anticarsia gemmatalis]|uniref:nitric oxide synthase-like n=1 Tax=Anticarsia gemmatalis TaxID=129554 RepID=UPI003F75C76D